MTKTEPKKSKQSAPAAEPLREKVARLTREVAGALVDRDEEVALTATALFGQTTLLLVGPPGTAKSYTLELFLRQLTQAKKFTYLVGKFTEPDELYGPVDLMALKNGVRRRVTADKLPEADAAFLDEYFKASTAILNTLLRIANERVFNNGAGDAKVPLRCLVAASNEYPQDGELGALFDRLLIRKNVKYLASAKSREKLIFGAEPPAPTTTITLAELDRATQELRALEFTPEARAAFLAIVETCVKEGVQPSDRRLKQSPNVVRAFAYVHGAAAVQTEHLEVLAHILWSDPEEQPGKVAKIVAKIANPIGMRAAELLGQIDSVFGSAPKANHSEGDATALANAHAKLTEVGNELKRMKETPAVLKALEYCRECYQAVSRRLINVKED